MKMDEYGGIVYGGCVIHIFVSKTQTLCNKTFPVWHPVRGWDAQFYKKCKKCWKKYQMSREAKDDRT